jgi:hypothetical protein
VIGNADADGAALGVQGRRGTSRVPGSRNVYAPGTPCRTMELPIESA